jgi:CRP/FNR family transcriptional regulator
MDHPGMKVAAIGVREATMPEAKTIEVFESSMTRTGEYVQDCDPLLREIHSLKTSSLNSLHPPGRVLFAEGEQARGVYILKSGSASVSVSSNDGRVLILKIACAGEVLGLNSVLRNSLHDRTVKTLDRAHTDFICRTEFLDLLTRSTVIKNAVLAIVSKELVSLGERAKSLLLSQTTSSKLAALLFEWYLESEDAEVGSILIEKKFTHEVMGQMVGCSRETVTRLLAAFRKSHIIQITPKGILVVDPEALRTLAFGAAP